MPRFIWTEEMSVGDALMDDQHKQIVDLLNTLNDHMTPKDIYHAITSMFHYAETHFRDEEKLLQDVGCPLLNKQQSEHQAFLSKASAFARQNTADFTLHIGLATFLTRWLVNHILTEDMKFKPYLQKRGLPSPT